MKLFGVRVPFTGSGDKRAASVSDDRYFTPSPFVYLTDEPPVTPETALRFSAVFGCVRIISQTLASLPLIVYERREDGGKDRATKHALYKLLRTRPNRFKTSGLEFREMLTTHALLYGNGYAQIIWNGRGQPLELVPMHPTRVRPDVDDDGMPIYRVQLKDGGERKLAAEEVLHIRAFRDAGLEGISPIAAARKAIQAGLSLESFGANFFEGGAFPAGVLEYPESMSDEAKKNLAESWQKLYGGENRGKKIAVLEGGLKWNSMGIPQSDAQFLEQRKFQVTEICRIYGVPPHLLADLDRATFSNIEEQNQNFVDFCLMPWFRRWEEAITRDLLDGDDSRYFAEFLADGLLRGNTAARTQAYAMGRQWGWFSINDIRSRENLNPIGPEGDVYLSPLNMVPAGEEGKQQEQQQEESREDTSGDEEQAVDRTRLTGAFRGAFRETWQRVVRKELNAVKAAARNKGEEFDAWFSEFSREHERFARDCLREISHGYFLLRDGVGTDAGDYVVREYRKSVRDRVDAWKGEPEKGYDHREDELASHWTERILNYQPGDRL